MEYKVGDWVFVKQITTSYCKLQVGDIKKVIGVTDLFVTTEGFGRHGGDILFKDIRLALPKEIPGYKDENYKQLKRILKQLKIK